jgi:hypothetical protein
MKSLYFIQCVDPSAWTQRGPIKIGFATDVLDRLQTLRVGCPYPLVLAPSPMHEPEFAEAELHVQFARYRMQGEWFAWTDELAATIARLIPTQQERKQKRSPSRLGFHWRGRWRPE